MASKQFNDYEENHYYDGLIQIAENMVPHGDPQFLAPGPSAETDAPDDISDVPNL